MKRSLAILLIILTLVLIQVACGLSNAPSGTISIEIATPEESKTAAAATSPSPGAAPTLLPTAAFTTSPSSASTAPEEASGNVLRLEFSSGATSTIVTGELAANETRGYRLTAQQGQVIIAGMPPKETLTGTQVQITTSDNVPLPDIDDNLDVVALLPAAQDYIVWVTAGSLPQAYHLAVTIPNRITFEPGAVSASIDGTIRGYHSISYVLRASAGQTMSVSLHSANTVLEIRGLDDHLLLLDPGVNATSWTGTLPATQDYIINVIPSVESVTYKLNVIIQ